MDAGRGMRVDLPLVDTDAHPRMHDDELAIDADLVRRLLAQQMPAWAGLPLRPVGRGTVNAMFRLGDDLAVRLPRTAEWAGDLGRERVVAAAAPRPDLAVGAGACRVRRADAGVPASVGGLPVGRRRPVRRHARGRRGRRRRRPGAVRAGAARRPGRRCSAGRSTAPRRAGRVDPRGGRRGGRPARHVNGARRVGPGARGAGLRRREGLDPHRPAPPEPAGPRWPARGRHRLRRGRRGRPGGRRHRRVDRLRSRRSRALPGEPRRRRRHLGAGPGVRADAGGAHRAVLPRDQPRVHGVGPAHHRRGAGGPRLRRPGLRPVSSWLQPPHT